MKVIIIGADGQLGNDLYQKLKQCQVLPLTHKDIEITDMSSVVKNLAKSKADVVINTAALVKAEDCEENPDKAFLVNALGARNIAVASQKIGANLVHISTDYVFGGEKEQHNIPYTEFDTPVPLSIYGKSKLAGENFVRELCLRHMIVRASGFFGLAGAKGKSGGNFVNTILKLAKERDELRVVNNQIFSPTSTGDLAQMISELINTEYYGTFHITNQGSCSWYEFACEIVRLAGLKTPVLPISSAEYPSKVQRPSYSVLGHYHLRLLGMDNIRPWQEALQEYMIEKGYSKG